MRGGKRKGAGRPIGTRKEPTIEYRRKIKPQWLNIMDDLLKSLKKGFIK